MKKEELRLDYLKNHPELKLYQSKEMFRINTDTCLLGEFISCNEDDNVLGILFSEYNIKYKNSLFV